jgi:hypothetical protein
MLESSVWKWAWVAVLILVVWYGSIIFKQNDN